MLNIYRAFSIGFTVLNRRAGGKSSGLGLALVKSIVDLHGGSVVIESNLGRGTTVKMIFPIVSDAKSRGTPSLSRGTDDKKVTMKSFDRVSIVAGRYRLRKIKYT